MADIYTVHFSFNGEPTGARFEYSGSAVALADHLHESELAGDVTVTDMRRNVIYEPDEEVEAGG